MVRGVNVNAKWNENDYYIAVYHKSKIYRARDQLNG